MENPEFAVDVAGTDVKVVATVDPHVWPEVKIEEGEACLVWGGLTLRFPAVAPDQPPAGIGLQFAMYLEAVQAHMCDEVAKLTGAEVPA